MGVQGVHVLPIGASERLHGLGRGGAGGSFWQGSVAIVSTRDIPRIRWETKPHAGSHAINNPHGMSESDTLERYRLALHR